MSPDRKSAPSTDKNISIGGDVVESVVIAGDNTILRRVGGGYIFIHRPLMDHFAEMYERS